MRIEPAHIDQIVRARSGRMIAISADVGGVVDDLKKIDPHLNVRFAESGNPPFWAVYEESDDGRTTHLVTTVQAVQTRSGIWSGLDQRVVDRIRQIDKHRGYDYGAELEKANRDRDAQLKQEFREQIGGTAEEAAFAIRKDLGSKNKAFFPKDLPPAA